MRNSMLRLRGGVGGGDNNSDCNTQTQAYWVNDGVEDGIYQLHGTQCETQTWHTHYGAAEQLESEVTDMSGINPKEGY
jgi:hypothetical protein